MKSVIHSPLPPLPTNKQQPQRYHGNNNQFEQQKCNQNLVFDEQNHQLDSKSPQKQLLFSSQNLQQRFSPQMSSQLSNVPLFYSPQHQKTISSSSSSFLSRAAQKIGLSTRKKSIEKVSVKKLEENFNIGNLKQPIQKNIFPPYQQPLQTLISTNSFFHHFSSLPPPLSKNFFLRCSNSSKVKIMVKINGSNNEKSACISVDPFKRHVTVFNPLSSYNRPVQFPKAFAYDAIFDDDDSSNDLCEESLADVVNGVLNGYDTCFLSYGHSRTEKEQSMFGCLDGQTSFGLIATCLSWMCQLTEHHNTNNNLNITPHNIKNSCSLAVSAFQITTKNIKDLLNPGAHISMNSDGTQLKGLNRCEIFNISHAGHVIDSILANKISSDSTDSSIHTFFIIYLIRRFQSANNNISKNFYEKIYKISFIDLDCKHSSNVPGGMTLNSFGLVILALLSGQREIPFRENKTAALLKTMMTSSNGHTSVLVHVSNKNSHLKESYQLLHLAAKMNKSGRKKNSSKSGACSESGGGRRTRKGVRMGTLFYSSACEGGFQTSDGEQLSTAGSLDSDDGFRPTPQSLSCAALDPVFEESTQPLQIMQQQKYQRRRTYKSNPSSTVSAPAYCQRKILAERTNKFSDLNNGVSNTDLSFEKTNKISIRNYKIKYNNLVKRNFNQSRHNTKELWIDGPNVKNSFISSSEKFEMNNLGIKDIKNAIDMGSFDGTELMGGGEKWVDGPDSFIAIPPLSKFSKIVKVSSLNNNFFTKLEQNIDSSTNYIITGNSEMALKNTDVKEVSGNMPFNEINHAKNANLSFDDFSPTSSGVPVDHSTPYATLEKFDVLHFNQAKFNGDHSHEVLVNHQNGAKKDDFRPNLDSVVEQAIDPTQQDNDGTLKAVLRTHDNSMYLTNRESLYEIKMDQNLEIYEHNGSDGLQLKGNTLNLQEDTLAKRVEQENDSIWNISTCTSLKKSLQTKNSTDWHCCLNSKTDKDSENFEEHFLEECNYTNCGKFYHDGCVLNNSVNSKVNCLSGNASDFNEKLQISVSKETVKTAVVSKIKMLDSDEDCSINISEKIIRAGETNEIIPQKNFTADDASSFVSENYDALSNEINIRDTIEGGGEASSCISPSYHQKNIINALNVSSSRHIEPNSSFDNPDTSINDDNSNKASFETSVENLNKEQINEIKEELVQNSISINSSAPTFEPKISLLEVSQSKSKKSNMIISKMYQKPSLLQKLKTPLLFRNKKNLTNLDKNSRENSKIINLKTNNNSKVLEERSPSKTTGFLYGQALTPKKSKIPVTSSMLDNNFKLNETNMKIKSNSHQKYSQIPINKVFAPTLNLKTNFKAYCDNKTNLSELKTSVFFNKKEEMKEATNDHSNQKINVCNFQKPSKNLSPFKSKKKFKKSNKNQLVKSNDFVYTPCHDKPPTSEQHVVSNQKTLNNLSRRCEEEIPKNTSHTHPSDIKIQKNNRMNERESYERRTSMLLDKSVFCGAVAAASIKAVSLASFCLNAKIKKKTSSLDGTFYNEVLYSSLIERKVASNAKTKKCNSLGNIYTYL